MYTISTPHTRSWVAISYPSATTEITPHKHPRANLDDTVDTARFLVEINWVGVVCDKEAKFSLFAHMKKKGIYDGVVYWVGCSEF